MIILHYKEVFQNCMNLSSAILYIAFGQLVGHANKQGLID